MRHHSPLPLHHLALLATLLPLGASADWRHLAPTATTASNPTGFVVAADRAFWTFGDGAISRSDTGGTRTLTREMLGASDADAPFDAGFALDGGDVILRSASCKLMRVDAQLRVKWRIDPAGCADVDVAADGTFWVARGVTLMQFGADGMQRQFVVVGRTLLSVEAQADGGAVAVSQNARPPFGVVARYGSDGIERWNSVYGAAVSSPLVTATPDGGAYVASILNSSLTLSRLDAQGAATWTTTHAVGADTGLADIQRSGDAVYIVTGLRTGTVQPRTLTRVGGDGQQQWQRPLCDLPGTPDVAVAREVVVSTDGSTAHACALQGIDRLIRRNAAGAVTARVDLPLETSLQLRIAGDMLYLLGQETPAGRPTHLLAIDAANRIAPAAPNAPAVAVPTRLHAHAVDGDGASYLLSKAEGIHGATLAKLDAQGRVVWQHIAPSLELYEARFRLTGTQLCSSELAAYQAVPNGNNVRRARCWDTRDGAGGWERQQFSSFTRLMESAPLTNGNTLLVVANTSDYAIEQIAPTGAIQPVGGGAGEVAQIGIGADGRSVLAVDTALAQHTGNGTRVYRVPSPLSEYRSEFAIAADGSVVVLGRRAALPGDRTSLWSVAPDGSTRWTVDLDAGFDRGRIARDGAAIYLLQYSSQRAATDRTVSRIVKLSATDGARIWQQESRNPTLAAAANDGGQMAIDGSGALLLAHAWPNKLRIERLDRQTGLQQDERFVDCNGACAQPRSLAFETAGGARLAAAVVDRQAGANAAVFSVDAMTSVAPPVRLDQPGVAGLWFSPYANGEGLAIDWLPASRTLFAAWFTFTTNGGNDPAGQRWYTLQVNGVPANATSLELPILETTGGNFDAGPAVSPEIIGRATLTFRDCSNATLRYRFDAGHNDAAEGTITLSRLTPQTQGCILANGSTQPGAGARPPAKGFDAQQSGAWYDDSAIGQGLQLNIQPDGVFFAPWFTYDPAGTQNDPGRQHWLTLQGDLAQAVDGRVELQLIQTIGGAFDRVPTYNAYAIGSATLRMLGCGRAALDYRFANAPTAGPYAGRSGTLDLKRMGDCAGGAQ